MKNNSQLIYQDNQGKKQVIKLPSFGNVKLKVQDNVIVLVETTVQEKL